MTTINRDSVIIIHNYINKNLFTPCHNWPEFEFKRRCYARWAAYEIINRIIEIPESEIFLTILYFMHEMDEFAGIRKDSEFIFITARNTAEEILSLF